MEQISLMPQEEEKKEEKKETKNTKKTKNTKGKKGKKKKTEAEKKLEKELKERENIRKKLENDKLPSLPDYIWWEVRYKYARDVLIQIPRTLPGANGEEIPITTVSQIREYVYNNYFEELAPGEEVFYKIVLKREEQYKPEPSEEEIKEMAKRKIEGKKEELEGKKEELEDDRAIVQALIIFEIKLAPKG